MSFRITGVIAVLFVLAGCASGPSVQPQMTETSGAIRAAKEVGAERNPEASLHVKLAQENEKRAQQLMQEGEKEQARRLFERAELDAELAIALIKEEQAKQDLNNVNQELSELDQRLKSK